MPPWKHRGFSHRNTYDKNGDVRYNSSLLRIHITDSVILHITFSLTPRDMVPWRLNIFTWYDHYIQHIIDKTTGNYIKRSSIQLMYIHILFLFLLRCDTDVLYSYPSGLIPWPHGGYILYQCQCGNIDNMMTSSNGNIFRVTGHLCGEFIGSRWIPHTKASDAELWCFHLSASE